MTTLQSQFIDSIHQIEVGRWNALFGEDYPFARHEFFSALEDNDCTNEDNGWKVHHLLIFDDERLVAAMPCYLKDHSYGEYIFDWSWAEAYHKHGLEFYPKILSAIPYTPATGPRVAIATDYQAQLSQIVQTIDASIKQLGEQIGASGWQCLFSDQSLHQQLGEQGWLKRVDVQFHWFNRNYQSFDDFVATFTSRKRKNILKERRKIAQSEIKIKQIEGHEITPKHWQAFFVFYQMTYLKRSKHGGYLNQGFFEQLSQTMKEHLMMVIAEKDDEIVAASLFFKSSNTLYGRYWGCIESHQFLHFECCYYQGIDYCIANNITKFDAGAQGEHKLQRGFEPVTTYANYGIVHPRFSHAIADFLKQEEAHIANYMIAAREHLPFKNE